MLCTVQPFSLKELLEGADSCCIAQRFAVENCVLAVRCNIAKVLLMFPKVQGQSMVLL